MNTLLEEIQACLFRGNSITFHTYDDDKSYKIYIRSVVGFIVSEKEYEKVFSISEIVPFVNNNYI